MAQLDFTLILIKKKVGKKGLPFCYPLFLSCSYHKHTQVRSEICEIEAQSTIQIGVHFSSISICIRSNEGRVQQMCGCRCTSNWPVTRDRREETDANARTDRERIPSSCIFPARSTLGKYFKHLQYQLSLQTSENISPYFPYFGLPSDSDPLDSSDQ